MADWRSHDIPATVAAAIKSGARNRMVAISLSTAAGPRHMRMYEQIARRNGVRILWIHRKRIFVSEIDAIAQPNFILREAMEEGTIGL